MSEQPPKVELEILNPDDVLVVGLNNRWFRTFTSSTDRYPCKLEFPSEFLNKGWNLLTGSYTNVALAGPRNDASVDYRVLVDGEEVLHVRYQTEVEAQTFTIEFKNTFHTTPSRQEEIRHEGGGRSKRFQNLMEWQKEGDGQG